MLIQIFLLFSPNRYMILVFSYDPSVIKFLKYDELQLAPEVALIGLEIWVIANDSNENVT